ncbi:MAG: hypothetical protein ABI947_15410, partial [Chloroflexota bacterium]
TIQYHDGRHPDQVATLIKMQASEMLTMAIHYRRANDKPLVLNHRIDLERFRTFDATLRKLGYDKLDDCDDIPWYGADLWLLERAASTFHHDMIVAPASVMGVHAEIVKLVRDSLHEAVRAINP